MRSGGFVCRCWEGIRPETGYAVNSENFLGLIGGCRELEDIHEERVLAESGHMGSRADVRFCSVCGVMRCGRRDENM